MVKAVKWNRGVVHGFSYSQSELEFFLDLGWYISFSGTVTYAGKKSFSDMSELVNYVPKDRLLIETDAPYQSPVLNHRHEPADVVNIYEEISRIRGISLKELCEAVEHNFDDVFAK